MGDVDTVRRVLLVALGSATLAGACGGQASRTGPVDDHDDTTGDSANSRGSTTASGTTATTTGPAGPTGSTTAQTGATGTASVTTGGLVITGGLGGASGTSSNATSLGLAGAAGAVGTCNEELPATPVCPAMPEETIAELSLDEAESYCGCSLPENEWLNGRFLVCVPAAPGQSCREAYPPECLGQRASCGLFFDPGRFCELPPTASGECCYVLGGFCAVGRPFTVAGQARWAPLRAVAPTPRNAAPPQAPSREACLALAEAYAADARTEHASIAAFSRFVLECLALGAPLALVEGAERALADEIEHTRLCANLARRYGAPDFEFGPIALEGAFATSNNLAQVAERVARESCIAETVSALLLYRASRAARDPQLSATLARMADDETRHAALGFQFLAWALATGDREVRFRVRRAFADSRHAVGFGARSSVPAASDELAAHGYLPIAERREVALRALSEVVAPCAQALFAGSAA